MGVEYGLGWDGIRDGESRRMGARLEWDESRAGR